MTKFNKEELTYLQKLINLFILFKEDKFSFYSYEEIRILTGISKEDLDSLIEDELITKSANLALRKDMTPFYHFKWNVCRPNILTVRIFIKRKQRYCHLYNTNTNEIQKDKPLCPYFEVQW